MKKIIFPIVISITLSGCETTYPTQYVTPVAQAKNPTATAGVAELIRISNDAAPELLPKANRTNRSIAVTIRDNTKSGSESLSIISFKLDSPGKRLLAGPHASGASWIDDNTIIYTYLRGQTPSLVMQSMESNGMRFLSPSAFGERDQLADYNSASSKFAFQTLIGGDPHIAVVDRDGKNYTVFVGGEYPRWTNDGKSIFFQKKIGLHDQIFILNLKDGSVTQLTSGPYDSNHAAPSPFQNTIAFTSNRDGNRHIYIMQKDGSKLSQITTGQTQEAFPDWLSENEIVFSSDAGAPSSSKLSPFNWPHADLWKVKLK